MRHHTLVAVITQAAGDEGAAYTLTYPDGRQVNLGDAEDNYSALAGVLDDEYEKPDLP